MEDFLLESIESCLSILSTQDEHEFLLQFVEGIRQTEDVDDIASMEITCSTEQAFFSEVIRDNPAPNCSLEDISEYSQVVGVVWKVAEQLDWFLFYVFHRRFGWPDLEEEGGYLVVTLPEAQGKYRKSSKTEELRFKAKLVDSLDTLILWIFHQPVTIMAVRMFSSALRLASASPVTRQQLSIHTMEWLKERLNSPDDDLFEYVRELLFLMITDVWSQIRAFSGSRLGPLIEKFSLNQTESIFEELCQLCEPQTNSWQATDGAVSAINTMIKRFQKVDYNLGDDSFSMSTLAVSPRVHHQICLGIHVLDRLPGYIVQKMKTLVFELVSNPQPTIRDVGIKAFVSCLNRCNEQDSELAFHEVYQRLQTKTAVHSTKLGASLDYSSPILQPAFSFLDPYTAESLLNLCLLLFKRLPDNHSYLENWDVCHRTFDVYLMHPASSVRLATSNLYKYIVARSISTPLLVKNILCCLIRKWSPNQTVLLSTVAKLTKSAEDPKKRPSVTDPPGSFQDESETWEWREGRLLVYELVCEFLIKNHNLYTFGRTTLTTRTSAIFLSSNGGEGPGAVGGSTDLAVSPTIGGNGCQGDVKASSYSGGNRGRLFGQPMSNTVRLSSSLSVQAFANLMKNKIDLPSSDTSDTALNTIKSAGPTIAQRRRRSQDTRVIQLELDRTRSKKLSRMYTVDSPSSSVSGSHSLPVQHTHPTNHNSSAGHTTKCAAFLVHVKLMEKAEEESNKHKANNGMTAADVRLPSFRSILCQMLHTCSEALADPQWELRRMSKQTFPCLGELLRWYDPALLADLVTTHLVYEPTLMTYACLSLLKDTLQHTTRLRALTSNSPSPWQNEAAVGAICCVLESVRSNLSLWLRSCHHYLARHQMDGVTPVTAHVVLLALVYFIDSPKDQESHVESLVNLFLRLDSILHNEDAGIPVLGHEIYPSLTMIPSVGCSPVEFCCHFVEELQEELPVLLRRVDVISTAHLLPIMSGWMAAINKLRTDTTECMRALVHSMNALCGRIIGRIEEDRRVVSKVKNEVLRTVETVASLIADKSQLESWWMWNLLEIIVQLISEVSVDISSLVQALLPRVRPAALYENATLPDKKQQRRESCGRSSQGSPDSALKRSGWKGSRQSANLQLYASQAHAESIDESDLSVSDSEEDKDKNGDLFPESLALTRRRTSTVTTLELSDDWDSDSEEYGETRTDQATQVAKRFLAHLSQCRSDLLLDAQAGLSEKDVCIINAITDGVELI